MWTLPFLGELASIFPDKWFSPEVASFWGQVCNGFDIADDIPAGRRQNHSAEEINEARSKVRRLLSTDMTAVKASIDPIKVQIQIKLDLDVAVSYINQLGTTGPGFGVTQNHVALAQTREQVRYEVFDPETHRWLPEFLSAYAGPTIDAVASQIMLDFVDYQNRGNRFEYYRALWRGECRAFYAHFPEARDEYQQAMNRVVPGSAEHKTAAIRLASCWVALGDRAYLSTRDVQNVKSQILGTHFKNALDILNAGQVDPTDPIRKEVQDYIDVLTARLNSNLNYFGTADNYVPILTVHALRELIAPQLNELDEAGAKFEQYLVKGNERSDRSEELGNALAMAQYDGQLLSESSKRAYRDWQEANRTRDLLDSQEVAKYFHWGQTALNTLIDAAEAIIANDPLGAAEGIISTGVTLDANKREFDAQREIARWKADSAWSQMVSEDIAAAKNAEHVGYLQHCFDTTRFRDLNEETYYGLANYYRSVVTSAVQDIVWRLYQYERAVAFKCGDEGERYVQFHYIGEPYTARSIIDLAGRLRREAFNRINKRAENVPSKFQASDTNLFSISLAKRYPLQFARFKNDPYSKGKIYFAISLYDISKKWPGVSDVRITRVKIKPVGLVSTGNYGGEFKHFGTFMVRNINPTLTAGDRRHGIPPATRLMPTAAQVEAALRELRLGSKTTVTIEGVDLYCVDADRIALSVGTENYGTETDPFAKSLMLDYGLCGAYSLTLTNVTDRELSNLVDIEISFQVRAAESNDDIGDRVVDLMKEYDEELGNAAGGERLDSIQLLSLRQSPTTANSWLSQLKGTGQASFALTAAMFPTGIRDLLVKLVTFQVLDIDGNGIQNIDLDYSNSDGSIVKYTRRRTTRIDGYTDDVTQPPDILDPSQRFPVTQGVWRIAALNWLNGQPDASVLQNVHDIKFFLMYEYTEGP